MRMRLLPLSNARASGAGKTCERLRCARN